MTKSEYFLLEVLLEHSMHLFSNKTFRNEPVNIRDVQQVRLLSRGTLPYSQRPCILPLVFRYFLPGYFISLSCREGCVVNKNEKRHDGKQKLVNRRIDHISQNSDEHFWSFLYFDFFVPFGPKRYSFWRVWGKPINIRYQNCTSVHPRESKNYQM